MTTTKFIAGLMLATLSQASLAGPAAVSTTIPTLDDLGLAVLIGMVGILGGWLAARRRK